MTDPTIQAHVAFDRSRFGVLIQIRTGQALRAFDGSQIVPEQKLQWSPDQGVELSPWLEVQ